MVIDDIMSSKITLHGLGFVQVQLPGNQRLHVWHPELPRRSCFEHSSVHNHRFGFKSTVLVGEQININVVIETSPIRFSHHIYLHEGMRTSNGGRPWAMDGSIHISERKPTSILAGRTYTMMPYEYHRTASGGDGKVATLMQKFDEGVRGAHSTCKIGVTPDSDFDRFQWSASRLWEVVSDVLLGAKPA